jgi:elongation factor Ts
MIELNCESDFVAKGDDFRNLAKELAMHIAAAAPRWITREEVPADLLEQEKEVALEQARNEGRPEVAWDKIVEGRLNNFYKENVLLEQAWVREPKTSIENLIKEQISKLQENITVRRFSRYSIKE